MTKLLSILALCAVSTAAGAADNGLYLGAGVGRSKFSLDSPLDSTDTGYKLIAGVRLLDNLGVELNYADFGRAKVPSGILCVAIIGTNCPDTSNIDGKALTAYAVGFVDLPVLDLFAKLGLSRTDATLRTPGVPDFGASDKGTELAWGLGVQAHFASLGVRAEYERFQIFGDEKVGTVSLSFVYTFL
jgi:opacity protein-like surface antigen